MLFNYRYSGESKISSNASSTGMTFAPDTLRAPTHFTGKLDHRIPFREAISALHDVVISDMRYQPRDTTEYKEWAKQQEDIWLAEYMQGSAEVGARLEDVRGELFAMDTERSRVMAPFYTAQREYFRYLYQRHRDAWWVLDPVITVHPDELFFECFSEDESSYGKLGCNYEVFKEVGEFACGTTNIDYSAALYNEFQKIRDYKDTQFTVDPSGFEVETDNEDAYKEVKIDLPESWVRGFLQVSSAMTLPGYTFDLHPLDVHNFCFILRRMKEKKSPRSMRFYLNPGEPVRVVFEPWNIEVVCRRSIYQGNEPGEVRVWGRRRILILERLIPIAKRFTVTLLGSGMPSFYVADLGGMNFTLGLSGWTANDWSRMGNFDLMAPRAQVDDHLKTGVFQALQENWFEEPKSLASRLNLSEGEVRSALTAYTQAGRAIYDLNKDAYRVRELSREPLPMAALRFENEREAAATNLVDSGKIKVRAEEQGDALQLTGKVERFQPKIRIDSDQRLSKGECDCNFYRQNKLFKGPCEHMLALRIAQSRPAQARFFSLK